MRQPFFFMYQNMTKHIFRNLYQNLLFDLCRILGKQKLNDKNAFQPKILRQNQLPDDYTLNTIFCSSGSDENSKFLNFLFGVLFNTEFLN